MGPFPHDAPKSVISDTNPAGTDGFEFVEFAHPEPRAAARGCSPGWAMPIPPRHKTRRIELWQQGDITYVLNDEPGSHALDFVAEHGPCAPSMAWRVVDAQHAFDHAVAQGRRALRPAPARRWRCRRSVGIGGSLIYFIEDYYETSPYNGEFEWLRQSKPHGRRVLLSRPPDPQRPQGQHGPLVPVLRRPLQLPRNPLLRHRRQIHRPDQPALTSPCGRIRIPINEDRGETGQIVEYLKRYKGEGIQHIAVGARDIYAATDAIAERGVKFMPAPPAAYYELSRERVTGHDEPIDRMARHGILIDGEGVVDGGETRILLQIFSKTVIGPIFFEFIQRKGDDGFGEGNFKALFESIEADQIARGVLKAG